MKYTIRIGKQVLHLDSDSEADQLLNGLQRLRGSDDVIGELIVSPSSWARLDARDVYLAKRPDPKEKKR